MEDKITEEPSDAQVPRRNRRRPDMPIWQPRFLRKSGEGSNIREEAACGSKWKSNQINRFDGQSIYDKTRDTDGERSNSQKPRAPKGRGGTYLSKSLQVGQFCLPVHMKYAAGTTINTQMTTYLSPSQFYLQPMTSNPEFRAMMQEMQAVVRSGTIKQNKDLKVGDFVIARYKADKVLYRGVILERGIAPKVQFVDYGNVDRVVRGSVWAMEKKYATLPIQAINCCLAGVQPTGETWPPRKLGSAQLTEWPSHGIACVKFIVRDANSTALDSHFEAETLDCSVLKELDGEGGQQYLVKLVKQGDDVAQKIVEAGLAVAGSDAVGTLSELDTSLIVGQTLPVTSLEVLSELDTSLIVGQTLPVTFLRVQEDYTLYVQPASEEVELKSLELEAGQGVKCVLSNVKEAATDEAREALTQLPGNTYIILLVNAVHSDRLQVTLFDGEGQLLALQENEVQSVEMLCPMPILNMHQKVWIAHASEDGIFLHKVMFADLLAELLQKLYDFYNESEPVEKEWSNSNLCCAKSVSDEQWYRARILETGEETKVQYIDYGNTEIIPINNLRQLDASFYTPHALALLVSLHVTWTVPVENLMELAGETEYNAVIQKKTGWTAELVDISGQSLTEKLVELGFATALENSPRHKAITKEDEVDTSEEMEEIGDLIHKSTKDPQEDVQQILEDLISSLASSNLDDTSVAAEQEVGNVSLQIKDWSEM